MTAPDSLPTDMKALGALLLAERTRHVEELAAARGKADRAEGEIARLMAIIAELQRHRFGRRSERLDPDQLALALEDLQQMIAAAQAAAEKDDKAPMKLAAEHKRQINRGALPPHLPREEIVIDVADKTCACCGGLKHRIGEDVAERLDVIPAQFKVIVTRRPKYACAACAGEVVQAPAPERLIEGGIPTEALVAHVLVAKYADHTPLYRQAQIYARQGITLDRSTLADWVGRAAFALKPVHARLLEQLKQSTKLFAAETTAPVLDPGRGRVKKGQLWAYARDERPWAGLDPPGVAYVYAPDRKHARPAEHLAGFRGTLQVDGYGAYADLAQRGDVMLAFCWSHVRRQFYDIQAKTPAPIATEALIRIAPSRWDGLTRFLDDGRIEIDSNVVERSIRPIALGRKNHLFAGSDGGGEHWAVIASLIETCKMNDVDPQLYLRDVLSKIVARHPMSRVDELLPFAYVPAADRVAA